MRTVDAVKGRWWEVFQAFGMPPINPRKHYQGECPICGKKGKLRIDDKDGNGTYICVCGAGDGFKLIQEATGMDFPSMAKEIDRIIGNEWKSEERPEPKDTSARDKAIRLFQSASAIRGTDGEVYLHSRGIYDMPRGGAKWGSVHGKPCIISLASTEFSEPRQMHCTFIQDGKKIEGTARKMFSLSPKDNQDEDVNEPLAIKLFQATDSLAIAEGIETALSAQQLYSVPAWSVMNATFMKKFRAPTGVKILYVYADNDRNLTGLAAAMECARANLLCSNDVIKAIVRWPKTLNDINDHLLEGDEVLEWTGTR